MKNIEIIATGKYLPTTKIDNTYLAKQLNITEDFIYKRTGIQTRHYSKDEDIEQLAIKCIENLIEKKSQINPQNIDMIIVATTSTNMLMPGISYKIQEHFNIENCMIEFSGILSCKYWATETCEKGTSIEVLLDFIFFTQLLK